MNTYLITGAAQGLGREIALQLAQHTSLELENPKLILLDKDVKNLNGLYDELMSLNCEPALFPMDLKGATPDDYALLHDTLEKEYGHLNGIFLNAASFLGFTPLDLFEIEAWYEIIQVNLNANFHLIQATLPLLKQAQHSLLIAISDAEVTKHPAYYGAYGVAKSGLEQLITTLAAEHQDPTQKTSPAIYLAKLEAFQSNTRSKHFPSENPATLPNVTSTAKHLLSICFEGLQSEYIHRLN